jgi:hypothetical protein
METEQKEQLPAPSANVGCLRVSTGNSCCQIWHIYMYKHRYATYIRTLYIGKTICSSHHMYHTYIVIRHPHSYPNLLYVNMHFGPEVGEPYLVPASLLTESIQEEPTIRAFFIYHTKISNQREEPSDESIGRSQQPFTVPREHILTPQLHHPGTSSFGKCFPFRRT